MNPKKLIGDLFTAFGAQGVSFLCSVLTTLMVPKILGVEEFGYWQLFIFYTSYVSFFQLGLNDGIYLQHGGESRSVIDKGLLKSECLAGLAYQSVAAALIAVYSFFSTSDAERSFVILSAAIYLLLSNTGFYFSYIFQAMNETRLSSYSSVVNRASYLIPLCACIAFGVSDFRVYVLFFIVSQSLGLAYSLWNAKDFLFAKTISLTLAVRETIRSMRVGIVLTVANVSGMLIMGLARLTIDQVWGVSAFGEVSLSLSIVNFALAFISQVAMVLFPALRMTDAEKLKSYYRQLRDSLGAMLPAVFLLYAPLQMFVEAWLPQYGKSLIYFSVLLPLCLFEVQTNLTVSTFLKVRNEPKALLLVNASAFACAAISILFAVTVFSSPFAVVLGALLGIAVRYMVGSAYLGKVYESRNVKLLLCLLMESVVFICIAYFLPVMLGFACSAALLAVHFIVCKDEISALLDKLSKFGK